MIIFTVLIIIAALVYSLLVILVDSLTHYLWILIKFAWEEIELRIIKLFSYKVTLYKVGETGIANIMASSSDDAITQASNLKKKFDANMYKLERR